MVLEGASTVVYVDVLNLIEGRRACKTTRLSMKNAQEYEFTCTPLQSFTVEAVEALQLFDKHGRYYRLLRSLHVSLWQILPFFQYY